MSHEGNLAGRGCDSEAKRSHGGRGRKTWKSVPRKGRLKCSLPEAEVLWRSTRTCMYLGPMCTPAKYFCLHLDPLAMRRFQQVLAEQAQECRVKQLEDAIKEEVSASQPEAPASPALRKS